MVTSRERTQRDNKFFLFKGNLKEGKNLVVPEEPGKMGIYTAMNERDLRVGE